MSGNGKDTKTGRFLTGNNASPGRPKGSRNKLGEEFLEKLYEDFKEHGVAAIKACRDVNPDTYIRVIAGLLPKEIQAEVNHRYVALLPAPEHSVEQWQEHHSPQSNQIQ